MPGPEIAPPTAEELRRLSLVRHLYGLGVAQSHGAEATAGLSILLFHDAAESFLQLASERYGAGENKADFMRYWELLAEVGVTVPQRETMRRLPSTVSGSRCSLRSSGLPVESFRLKFGTPPGTIWRRRPPRISRPPNAAGSARRAGTGNPRRRRRRRRRRLDGERTAIVAVFRTAAPVAMVAMPIVMVWPVAPVFGLALSVATTRQTAGRTT